MTKSKHRAHKYPTTRTAAATQAAASQNLNEPVGFKDYVLLNAVFDIFCIVQLIILSMLMDEMPGLVFFFVFIMVAFLVVSIVDYFASRFTQEDEPTANVGVVSGDAA